MYVLERICAQVSGKIATEQAMAEEGKGRWPEVVLEDKMKGGRGGD